MKIQVTSKISGSEILKDGVIVGRLESYSGSGGCTYVMLRDERGTYAAARFKYRLHRRRAVEFTKLLLGRFTVADVITTIRATGKSGGALLEPTPGLGVAA